MAFAAGASTATTPSWSAIADLPDGQTCGSAAELNGMLYVMGGTTGSAWSPPAVFDPTHNSWSGIPDMLMVGRGNRRFRLLIQLIDENVY